MSIHPILEKIKAFMLQIETEAYLMILIIILVGMAGFGLGKLSNTDMNRAVIIQTEVMENTQNDSIGSTQNTAGAINVDFKNNNNIVASKNGTKYYFPSCSGVGRIQDQNKVFFTSEQEALDAGYVKANGCN
jgi:hypothetical protein